ncbi:CLUMA_CG018743, isoform A [Clunio marinus]|uniref:CLUMA_CG018743, isoform A n=1 Tax=Clunio marinus TaxID=568069 RepID=A0A1J1J4C0_9DIPT|nr:CLUMA_CG018743, isoform A [Clunio marinus]
MVMKMNETTVTETFEPIEQNATTVTITLHPQPNEEAATCDKALATTSINEEAKETKMSPSSDDSLSLLNSQMLVKKSLKLELTHNNNEIKSIDTGSPEMNEDLSFKSPTSPRTCRNRSVPHQTSLTSQVEVVDDRKALRDALYQGIFHRHRRTIFAVGSFLRMLKSRSSQYNTIRSSSEGEEEAR